jgi:hypothetical protein
MKLVVLLVFCLGCQMSPKPRTGDELVEKTLMQMLRYKYAQRTVRFDGAIRALARLRCPPDEVHRIGDRDIDTMFREELLPHARGVGCARLY